MIKKINIAEEFGQMEKLVSILSSPEQKWNLDKVGWNQSHHEKITNSYKFIACCPNPPGIRLHFALYSLFLTADKPF